MEGQGLLLQTLVYLGAGVIAAPIAKRLGLGSVLGYLIAGIIIGNAFERKQPGQLSGGRKWE
jgi:Kef-type K+ transport system membrane component KefB